jgi:2-methylcitrate dehydratase PrpD
MALSYQEFIHQLRWDDVPLITQDMTRRCLLDLLGVAASGTQTRLSNIIRSHALSQFGAGDKPARLLMDGRECSAAGAALAGGMTIDSIDAHDGYKPVKGHAGCGVLPALLAFLDAESGAAVSEAELLTGLLIGYEIACRAGASLHDSACDYHTSGAWVALAAAAIGARVLKLDAEQTRHALGIAEYHGPRSQMMRCIDHPTMVKDGSGWGSMAGVSAAFLAKSGFTGAPAITIEAPEQAHFWNDLGENWLINKQYFKPFPVCRWAQPAVIAAFKLRDQYDFDVSDIEKLSIGTFHESIRLATAKPQSTEEAQYSLPFPVAAAIIHMQVTVKEVEGAGLEDEAVLALSQSIELYEVEAFNEVFPEKRISELTITLKDGRVLESGPTEADGDPESPLSEEDIDNKFLRFATPVLGMNHASKLMHHVRNMGDSPDLKAFNELIYTAGVKS